MKMYSVVSLLYWFGCEMYIVKLVYVVRWKQTLHSSYRFNKAVKFKKNVMVILKTTRILYRLSYLRWSWFRFDDAMMFVVKTDIPAKYVRLLCSLCKGGYHYSIV